MRKILILLLLVTFALGAGCSAARKPAPAPEQKPSVVPETSKVGFSAVDLNKAPDVVKNIASDLAKREAATWVLVNGANYVLVSAGEKATGKKVEITDVTQKVPAQDFIWIDVKAQIASAQAGDKSGPVTVVSLSLPTDRTINGVGFELTRAAAATPTPAPTAPTPAPTTPTPAPAPAPAAPAPKPAPTPAPAPAPGKAAPETPPKKQIPPESQPQGGQ
jgi:hypothetical protein